MPHAGEISIAIACVIAGLTAGWCLAWCIIPRPRKPIICVKDRLDGDNDGKDLAFPVKFAQAMADVLRMPTTDATPESFSSFGTDSPSEHPVFTCPGRCPNRR